MDTVHHKADECQTSIIWQLHRNRMTSKMAIEMFTILNGYRYNIYFVSMLLSEMVTSAEINLINRYQYTLKNIQKQNMPTSPDSRTLGQTKAFHHQPSPNSLSFE